VRVRDLRWQFWVVFLLTGGFVAAAAFIIDAAPEHRDGPAGPHQHLSLASVLVCGFGLYVAAVAMLAGSAAQGRGSWALWLGSAVYGFVALIGVSKGLQIAAERPSRPDHVGYSGWLLLLAVGLLLMYLAFVVLVAAGHFLRRGAAAEPAVAPGPRAGDDWMT
jgi:hypothetical protein